MYQYRSNEQYNSNNSNIHIYNSNKSNSIKDNKAITMM